MSFTTNDLIIVLSQCPELTSHGCGIPHDRRRPPLQTAHEFYTSQAELFARIDAIAKLVEWLRPRPRLKHPTVRSQSYTLKHQAEEELGEYFSNGELLAAAIHLAVEIEEASGRRGLGASLGIGQVKRLSVMKRKRSRTSQRLGAL